MGDEFCQSELVSASNYFGNWKFIFWIYL